MRPTCKIASTSKGQKCVSERGFIYNSTDHTVFLSEQLSGEEIVPMKSDKCVLWTGILLLERHVNEELDDFS